MLRRKIRKHSNDKRGVCSIVKETCVAYLDLLGFSAHVKENVDASVSLLHTASEIFTTRLCDQKTHPINSYRSELRPLAKRQAVDTFISFLPMSDGIFIVGKSVNNFIEQVSSFMCACFMDTSHYYAYPENESDPESVTVSHLSKKSNDEYAVNKMSTKYYPAIFRGGLCIGKSALIDVACLFRNEESVSPDALQFIEITGGRIGAGKIVNIAGEGVVAAVELERNGGKGPKLFIDDYTASQLNDELKLLVLCDPNEKKHFLWPAYTIIASNGMQRQRQDNYFDFLSATISLWKAYENKGAGVSCHYYQFMRITAQAYLSVFKHHANETEARAILCDFFNQKGVDVESLPDIL